ncbi:hypothetical protein CONPUDRAFT_169115 [Coniophora puteana RWD-64-598 SS2]|uniref:Vps72/YL1 C-terminal domain-containing protein n=1 Tax=Coniophora puteana (strain RWD-64-598) TaxID=741705 RepID=A0A5M3M9S2_CONPW|nr:uncharacterized protein CONPUDRAFT_169115 [Coniophora puteana RWD-64-598 SS2]EIW75863.1 hypothetical protein CONPUDRAFT_169115 [Coniophora puteana RWD-64-598 SS2]
MWPPKGAAKKKAAAAQEAVATATPPGEYEPTLSEQLSYLQYARPFKNPNYTKGVGRRTKILKTVLGQERERERQERERKRLEREEKEAGEGEAMDVDVKREEGEKAKAKAATPGVVVVEEEVPTYLSIEAPPSLLPQRHYCDITGLEAPYTDPRTNLRYHDKSVYELIKNLSPSAAKDYLAARGVNPIVK